MTLFRWSIACAAASWVWLACETSPGRQATTVRHDYATLRDDAAVDAVDAVDAVEVTAPDANGEVETFPDTIIETFPDTIVETIAETVVPETVAETTPETIAETTPETIAETVQETVSGDTDPGPDVGEPCQVGSLGGTCRHIADCPDDAVAAEGFCDAERRIRCCLTSAAAWERCSAARAPGVCMSTGDCPGPAWQSTSGLCPGPADIQCCTSTSPPPVCDPDIRPTPNDGLVEEPGDPGCPPGMARVGTVCIDRFEASLVSAADPMVSLSPYHNPGANPARAVSIRWAVPQGYIDEVRAKSACENAGKRLCTSDEWRAVCRGDAGWTYPYGPAREPGRCNDDRRQHVAYEFFGTTQSWVFSEIDNACLSQLPASLDLAGENEGCRTPTGVYDLMGNLHEWIDDSTGTFLGGFFDDTVINGEGCLYRTTAHTVGHWDYSTGFRCCADPAP